MGRPGLVASLFPNSLPASYLCSSAFGRRLKFQREAVVNALAEKLKDRRTTREAAISLLKTYGHRLDSEGKVALLSRVAAFSGFDKAHTELMKAVVADFVASAGRVFPCPLLVASLRPCAMCILRGVSSSGDEGIRFCGRRWLFLVGVSVRMRVYMSLCTHCNVRLSWRILICWAPLSGLTLAMPSPQSSSSNGTKGETNGLPLCDLSCSRLLQQVKELKEELKEVRTENDQLKRENARLCQLGTNACLLPASPRRSSGWLC